MTEQRIEDVVEERDDAAGGWWLAFSANTSREEMLATFRAKHGREPAQLRQGRGGLLLAGPVPAGSRPR
jgi:hypothetical protein